MSDISTDGTNLHVAVITSRFNEEVTQKLEEGAIATLIQHGVAPANITQFSVPGAFEVPQLAQRLAVSGQYHGIVCLGAVIQGETAHFDYVCQEVSRGIQFVGMTTGVPVGFGILTTETKELALARAGGKKGNKGDDAALTVLEMCNLVQAIPLPGQ